METTIHDFISVLNDSIDSRFPNTKRYIVDGGDYINDLVFELREGNKKYRYSPYELYNQSKDYEETIEQFIQIWKGMLL